MPAAIDLSGHSYGRLLVLGQRPNNKFNQRVWRCLCDCGNTVDALGYNLRYNKTRSCGCIQREDIRQRQWKHGFYEDRHTPAEASAYYNARQAANRYGVAFRYASLEEFIEDVGRKPRRGYVLSRVDPELDYQPGNCYWRKRLTHVKWQERGWLTLLPGRHRD